MTELSELILNGNPIELDHNYIQSKENKWNEMKKEEHNSRNHQHQGQKSIENKRNREQKKHSEREDSKNNTSKHIVSSTPKNITEQGALKDPKGTFEILGLDQRISALEKRHKMLENLIGKNVASVKQIQKTDNLRKTQINSEIIDLKSSMSQTQSQICQILLMIKQ